MKHYKLSYMMALVTIALVGTLSVMAACSNSKTASSNSEMVAAGKQLYETDCASCHGIDGAGGMKIGDATAADIRFNALDDMYNGDWSLAKDAILNGKDEEGEDLDDEMPLWKGKLSNTEVDDIIAYMKTLR